MKPIVSRPGDGERYVRENRVVTIRLELPQLSIQEIEFDSTFAVPQHTHSHADATYVLDGEVEFLHGDDVLRASAGTLIAAPAGTPHGFRNPGPGRARILALHAPDGGFARLVRDT